jgi:hypothetical protein
LHLVELSDDKECTSLDLLTKLPADAVRIPVGVRIVVTGLTSRKLTSNLVINRCL